MKLLMILAFFVTSTSAISSSRIVTIDAFDFSYTGGLLVKKNKGPGADHKESNFRLNLNYAQNWEQYVGLMWRARAYINRQNVDYGANDYYESAWGAGTGLLYNFDSEDIKNAFFAGFMIGAERATFEMGAQEDRSGTNFFADFEFGKRFDLGHYSVANISYAPAVSVTLKRYGGDIRDDYFRSGNEIKLHFLKFDILF